MEKLELKHISPYLPYGINAILLEQLNGSNRFQQTDCFVIGASEDYIYTDSFFDEVYYHEIKPILRPIEELYDSSTDFGIKIVHYFNFRTNVKLDCKNFPYHVMEQLFKNHFDVFGLIDKGLAVSYSDIQSSSNEG